MKWPLIGVALAVTLTCSWVVARAQSFTPAPGQTFSLDLDSKDGERSLHGAPGASHR